MRKEDCYYPKGGFFYLFFLRLLIFILKRCFCLADELYVQFVLMQRIRFHALNLMSSMMKYSKYLGILKLSCPQPPSLSMYTR